VVQEAGEGHVAAVVVVVRRKEERRKHVMGLRWE